MGGLDDCSVAISSILNPLAVDTRRTRSAEPALSGLLSAVVVNVLDVEGVQVAREVTGLMGQWTLVLARARGPLRGGANPRMAFLYSPEQRQANVDEEIGSAARNGIHARRRDCNSRASANDQAYLTA